MNSQDTVLSLIRLGVGKCTVSRLNNVDWASVKAFAIQQGLSAVVLDGIELLPEHQRPPKTILLEWIGEVLREYEQRYEQYRRTIAEMAGFYNSHGYKMMVLKGFACSLDWPRPEHRPCGDIDIWLFGQQKEADALLMTEKGIKVDKSHHHHTVFYWNDFMVENHYDFINVHSRKSNRELEKLFKELGVNDSCSIAVSGEKVYLPSPNLHALFLIRHIVAHFTSTSISLRQVLDWAFFVEMNTNVVDWEWLLRVLDDYHLIDFFNCINGICVEDLGFSPSIFPKVQFLPCLKDRVLNDIISPEYTVAEPKGEIQRLMYKYRRWQGNAWKQELCFNESRWSGFWMGLWSHLLKPSLL